MKNGEITKFVAKSAPSFNYAFERLSKQISLESQVGVVLVHELAEEVMDEWQFQRNIPARNLFIMSEIEKKEEIQKILQLLDTKLFHVISSKRRREHAIEIAKRNFEIALQIQQIKL